jgi:hypothetical protein
MIFFMAKIWAPGTADTFVTDQYYDRFYADSFAGQPTLYKTGQKRKEADYSSRPIHPVPLACMFHEGGCVSHVFAKQINLIERLLGIGAQGQFAPIHFQEKFGVTD